MKNCFVRIDDRLVHGQRLESWIPCYDAKAIVIIDYDGASDPFREAVIRMMLPQRIDLAIYSAKQFVEEQRRSSFLFAENTIFISSNTANVLEIFNGGFSLEHLNVGNICSSEAVKMCSPSVMLNAADIKNLQALLNADVKIMMQRTPADEPIAIASLDD